jgi:hypothetical protein
MTAPPKPAPITAPTTAPTPAPPTPELTPAQPPIPLPPCHQRRCCGYAGDPGGDDESQQGHDRAHFCARRDNFIHNILSRQERQQTTTRRILRPALVNFFITMADIVHFECTMSAFFFVS